jgi:E3 Ubiquitin ligase
VGVFRSVMNVVTTIFIFIVGTAALGIPLIAGMGVWERIRLIALRRTRLAHTGELAGAQDKRVVVRGVLTSPVRLTAPLSGRPCVWYRVEIIREYEEIRDTTNSSDERVWEYESAEPLSIDDGSGPVRLRLSVLDQSVTVEGGNPRETTDASRRLAPGEGWYRDHEALSRMVDDGLVPVERLASPRKTLEFTVKESVIPADTTVTLIARVTRRDSTATLVRGYGPAYGVSNQTPETLRKRLAEDAQAPWGIMLAMLVILGLPLLLCLGLRVLVGLPYAP